MDEKVDFSKFGARFTASDFPCRPLAQRGPTHLFEINRISQASDFPCRPLAQRGPTHLFEMNRISQASDLPRRPLTTRDNEAKQLVADITKSLRISLGGKSVIDVGCRSCENTLAMQAAGATVIGIDPDKGEFGVAKEKGMKDSQLVNATLQEYYDKNPEVQFDIATVFLRNIAYDERKDFVTALSKIVKPGGYIIIGYHDDVYHDYSSSLYIRRFIEGFRSISIVTHQGFSGRLNQYMLVCKVLGNHVI